MSRKTARKGRMTLAYTDTSKMSRSVALPFLPAAFRERGFWRQQHDASRAAQPASSAAPARAARTAERPSKRNKRDQKA